MSATSVKHITFDMRGREDLPLADYEVRQKLCKEALKHPERWVGLTVHALLERLLEALATVFPVEEQQTATSSPHAWWSVVIQVKGANYINLRVRGMDTLALTVIVPHTPSETLQVLLRDPSIPDRGPHRPPDPKAILDEFVLHPDDLMAIPGLVSLVKTHLENSEQFKTLTAIIDEILDAPVTATTNYTVTEVPLDLMSVVEEVLGKGPVFPSWTRPKEKKP